MYQLRVFMYKLMKNAFRDNDIAKSLKVCLTFPYKTQIYVQKSNL